MYLGQTGQPTSTLGVDGIIPQSSGTYNIGQLNNPFSNVYSKNFTGNFNGNLTGGAQFLSNTSTFALGGQLTGGLYFGINQQPVLSEPTGFNGQAGNYVFNAQLSVNSITSQTSTSTVAVSDSLLVATAVGAGVNLAQITKANLLQDLYDNLVPAGTIVPWAGVSPLSSLQSAGVGNRKADGTYNWLICDGSFFYEKDYPSLFAAISYTYGGDPSVAAFQVPDMRGRMIIGYDNMSNNFIGSPSTAAGRVPGANVPNAELANQGLAPAVTGGSNTATVSTGVTGPDGVLTTTSTQITGVMNPYFAFNYIIKT